MFVRPTWSTHGVGVAWPQEVPCAHRSRAPLTGAPSSADTAGAKWEGVCSAQSSRLPARIHVQAVVEWVPLPPPHLQHRASAPPALPSTTSIVLPYLSLFGL